MWFFVLGDMIIFAAYFVAFLIFRAREHALFDESQLHLDVTIGVVNTLVMLASSWFMARAVLAARAGDTRRISREVMSAGGCGVLFVVLKLVEWWAEINNGFTLTHNTFFGFYYMLTGVHLLHVVMGLIILAVVIARTRNGPAPHESIVEQGATYWHMVDLLWVIIFALVYVAR